MARFSARTAARTLRLAAVLFLAAAAVGFAATAHAQAGFRPRFAAQTAFAVHIGDNVGRQAVVLADLNGDTRPDLVAIAPQEESVDVFLNDGSGSFVPGQQVDLEGLVPVAVALADVTSPSSSETAGAPDGLPDLLVGADGGELLLLPGLGDGTFTAEREPLDSLETSEIIGIATGNFDADAATDVALLDVDGVLALCNDGGVLASCGDLLPVGDDPIEIVTGDFDGDSDADLAVLDRANQRLHALRGAGDGSFTAATPINVAAEATEGESVDVVVARVDDDAIDDLVIANRHQFLQFLAVTLLGTTRGQFRTLAFVIDFDATALAVADFDDSDDGVLDAIVGYAGPTRGGLTANLGESAGAFADPFIPVGSNTVGAIALLLSGDLDGDGIVDLLTVGDDGAHARVLLNATVPFCNGDCNGNGVVSIDELMRGVGIVLGDRDVRDCVALDADMTFNVGVSELVAAVARALDGCPTE